MIFPAMSWFILDLDTVFVKRNATIYAENNGFWQGIFLIKILTL